MFIADLLIEGLRLLNQRGRSRQSNRFRIRLRTVRFTAKRFRHATALALIFWCAGAGCMMVSYARAEMSDMDSSAQPTEQPMAHMSGSMGAHECCKAKHRADKRTQSAKRTIRSEFTQFSLPSPTQSDAMNCCPLTSGSIVVASRSQSNDPASELAHPGSRSLESTHSYSTPVAIPLRLPNRAESYLLDCAFLI